MNKKEIENQYNKKIKLIKIYNEYYYDKSQPKVADKEYDELKKEITNLEKEYNFLKSKKSPSEIVGHKPSKNFKVGLKETFDWYLKNYEFFKSFTKKKFYKRLGLKV